MIKKIYNHFKWPMAIIKYMLTIGYFIIAMDNV